MRDMTTLTDLKHTHRATWAAGDYAALAEHIDAVPPRDLLNHVAIAPGQDVLNVATGTGNVALRAAAAGAHVVGLDLTPELFTTARRRAAEYRVAVEWIEGDAEALPFADAPSTAFAPCSASSSRRSTRSSRPSSSRCPLPRPHESGSAALRPPKLQWRSKSHLGPTT